MRAYHSMPTSKFVDQLRDVAIKAGARAAVIYQIDSIADAPSEDSIAEQIAEAVDEAEIAAFSKGKAEGEQTLENAVEDAVKEMYTDCCAAIEAKGKEIGLTDEQIDKVVNHILWDVRP